MPLPLPVLDSTVLKIPFHYFRKFINTLWKHLLVVYRQHVFDFFWDLALCQHMMTPREHHHEKQNPGKLSQIYFGLFFPDFTLVNYELDGSLKFWKGRASRENVFSISFEGLEAVIQMCYIKKVLLKISHLFYKSCSPEVFSEVLSCEFCEIHLFTEQLWTTASKGHKFSFISSERSRANLENESYLRRSILLMTRYNR